jgi:hypothetical protein
MDQLRTSYCFNATLKLHSLPAYRIAQKAGVNPDTLSKLVNGAIEIKPGDERVIAVGQVLGLDPGQCFERVNQSEPAAVALGKEVRP